MYCPERAFTYQQNINTYIIFYSNTVKGLLLIMNDNIIQMAQRCFNIIIILFHHENESISTYHSHFDIPANSTINHSILTRVYVHVSMLWTYMWAQVLPVHMHTHMYVLSACITISVFTRHE